MVDEEGDPNSRSSWSTAFFIILENLDASSMVFPDISIFYQKLLREN